MPFLFVYKYILLLVPLHSFFHFRPQKKASRIRGGLGRKGNHLFSRNFSNSVVRFCFRFYCLFSAVFGYSFSNRCSGWG